MIHDCIFKLICASLLSILLLSYALKMYFSLETNKVCIDLVTTSFIYFAGVCWMIS